MANQVIVHSQYLEFIYQGDQSQETVQEMVAEGLRQHELHWGRERLPVVLANLEKLGRSTLGSRKASFEALSTINFQGIAILSSRQFYRQLAQLVTYFVPKDRKIEIFDNRQMAVNWLISICGAKSHQ